MRNFLTRYRQPHLQGHLLLDPGVGAFQALFKCQPGFPFEHLAQARVVRVAPAHAHWPGNVFDRDLDPSNVGDDPGKLVYGHDAIRTQVQRQDSNEF